MIVTGARAYAPIPGVVVLRGLPVRRAVRRRFGLRGLGFACPVAPTTDYTTSVLGGVNTPISADTLSTSADANELISEWGPFYKGSPTVYDEAAANPIYTPNYVDGTGRKVYALSYPGGPGQANVGQALSSRCSDPSGSWQMYTGPTGNSGPIWSTPQAAAAYNAANAAIRAATPSAPVTSTTPRPAPSPAAVVASTPKAVAAPVSQPAALVSVPGFVTQAAVPASNVPVSLPSSSAIAPAASPVSSGGAVQSNYQPAPAGASSVTLQVPSASAISSGLSSVPWWVWAGGVAALFLVVK